MITVYESYQMYQALKLHFNTKYDYIKYQGKIKLSKIPESQKFVFEKLLQRYSDNLQTFYIANFLNNPKVWVHDLLSDDCDVIYKKHQKKKESLTYLFKNDIISLVNEHEDLNKILKVNDDFPILMKLNLQNEICLETTLLLNHFTGFFKLWDKKLCDNIVYKPYRIKCEKYYPFIEFNEKRIKEIIKNEVKNDYCKRSKYVIRFYDRV